MTKRARFNGQYPVEVAVDTGNVYSDFDAFDAGELRASTGLALMWRSPMGPIAISGRQAPRQQPAGA